MAWSSDRGLRYILSCVKNNGYIQANGTRMYSHAFATLLLAEIYGMTRRRDVRVALQRAITVIEDSQNAEGGWRYQLFARESDMSITVCQVMALRSARNVGITVPKSTITRAENYVTRSSVQGGRRGRRRSYGFRSHGIVNSGGAFRYQLRSGSRATFPLTAAGVTTLYAAGNYDSPLIEPALDYLTAQMKVFNSYFGRRGHYFFYYGHYYAVQAFFVAGGSRWKKYFTTMRTQLLNTQGRDGSWPCEVGPGRAFSTAVATLILQIPTSTSRSSNADPLTHDQTLTWRTTPTNSTVSRAAARPATRPHPTALSDSRPRGTPGGGGPRTILYFPLDRYVRLPGAVRLCLTLGVLVYLGYLFHRLVLYRCSGGSRDGTSHWRWRSAFPTCAKS